MTHPIRKPRIALMGEFSAGKSTLSNLLLGARPLPERVTATRLSPVWMSHGTQAPYRVALDGSKEPISLDKLDTIAVEDTRVIKLFFDVDVLQICDLIDFPGISDPNMSPEVWQRMLEEVDGVLWCTHATQAWRQSEAAVWETMPELVREHSALLITRFDKLTTERDRFRVQARLKSETKDLFAQTIPISLTGALAAADDYDAFEASGGIALLQYFIPMVEKIQANIAQNDQTMFARAMTPAPEPVPDPVPAPEPEIKPELSKVAAPPVADIEADVDAAPRTMPRRVRPQTGTSNRPRPLNKTKNYDADTSPSQMSRRNGKEASQLKGIFTQEPASGQ